MAEKLTYMWTGIQPIVERAEMQWGFFIGLFFPHPHITTYLQVILISDWITVLVSRLNEELVLAARAHFWNIKILYQEEQHFKIQVADFHHCSFSWIATQM